MGSFTISLTAYGKYVNDIPTLQVWNEGVLDSGYLVSDSGTVLTLTLSSVGAVPSSLAFSFDDALLENGRTIDMQIVRINDHIVNMKNLLTLQTLEKGDSAVLDTGGGSYLFDDSDPPLSLFSPSIGSFSAANDSFRKLNSSADLIINALEGRDVIYSGNGADRIYGHDGDDVLYSGGGDDIVSGGLGADKIYGQAGDDALYGGSGADRLLGDAGADLLSGGADNDILNGGAGIDRLLGGAGDDRLNGGADNDVLHGDDGHDRLIGGAGADVLDGGTDDDMLYGGGGR